jgi:hypothetical protein
LATVTFGDFEWDAEKAAANAGSPVRRALRTGAEGCGSSARGVPLVENTELMSEDENPTEPSEESLRDIPELDFSCAIQPNRYANLRGAFQHAVFVDREIWEHFGSAECILETLRLLVDIAKKRTA